MTQNNDNEVLQLSKGHKNISAYEELSQKFAVVVIDSLWKC